jgi:hypothetical protein
MSDDEWSKLYYDTFGSATGKYFGSVKNLGYEWINISFKGSSVAYCTAVDLSKGCKTASLEKPQLVWKFVYKIDLQNVIPKEGIVNQINSTEKLVKEYPDFINLNSAKDCASDFFKDMDKEAFKFTESPEYNVRTAFEQKINQVSQEVSSDSTSPCSGFKLSTDIFGEIGCGEMCFANKMHAVSYILLLEADKRLDPQKSGAVSFMNEFNKFEKGDQDQGSSNAPCSVGSNCKVAGEDCVKGVCGKCFANIEGADCSPSAPSGKNYPLGAYKCYKTLSGDYNCLEKKEGIYLMHGDSKIIDGGYVDINCGLNDEILVLKKPSSVSTARVTLNDVEISPSTDGSIDICGENIPQASGQIEVYLPSGSDEYQAYSCQVNFALDTCISGISKKLDGYVFQVTGEEAFSKLDTDLKKSVLDTAKTVSCEGYDVSVLGVSRSCGASCVDPTTWSNEKYSIVTIEFKEKKTGGNAAAHASYIISYSP